MVEKGRSEVSGHQSGGVLSVGQHELKVLADLGGGLVIAQAPLEALREQDENARVMSPEQFNQLVANIKRRGMLESLPYCVRTERGVEIVSGHHRTRAARAAGLQSIPILLDLNTLTRSNITAKQVAHNTLQGFDDKDILKRLASQIQEVDDLLEAFLPKDIKPEPSPADMDKFLAPHLKFEWKTVALAFLPHQLAAFKELIDLLPPSSDLLGVAPVDCFEAFCQAVEQYGKFKSVTSVATVVALLSELARDGLKSGLTVEDLIDAEGKAKQKDWVDLVAVVGHDKIPPEAAAVIRQAVDRMLAEGAVTKKNAWQALELWAADYLAASPSATQPAS